MNYKISPLENKTPIYKGKEITGYLSGFAFLDEKGCCAIIVYGERQRDLMDKYLKKNNK